MMRGMRFRPSLLVPIFLLAATPAPAAPPFQKVAGAAIASRVTGMQFGDGVHFSEIFHPGGRLVGTYAGSQMTGRWHVEGDDLCLTRERNGGERCFEVWMSGPAMELRQPGTDIKEEGSLKRPMGRS